MSRTEAVHFFQTVYNAARVVAFLRLSPARSDGRIKLAAHSKLIGAMFLEYIQVVVVSHRQSRVINKRVTGNLVAYDNGKGFTRNL